jgi:hypothetical protein
MQKCQIIFCRALSLFISYGIIEKHGGMRGKIYKISSSKNMRVDVLIKFTNPFYVTLSFVKQK